MKNRITITIKPRAILFNPITLEEDIRHGYITAVHGNRLEVEHGLWYLFCGSVMITSGNTRDLHGVHNKFYEASDGSWSDIALDYTPVTRF